MRQVKKKQREAPGADRTSPAREGGARKLARPIMALAAIVIGLLLGEVAVRWSGLAPAVRPIVLSEESTVYRRSANPLLGFELKADYQDDNADLKRSYPRTNAHGQRDIARSVEKPDGVRRVILLGDSVVEGFGIRDLDDTISRQLERLYPDGSTEVLNFGVSAYCTLAEVELLRVKGLQFDPDVVVLVFVGNDFDNFNREAFQLGPSVNRPAWVESLFVHSEMMRLIFLHFNLFQFHADTDPVNWNRKAIGDNNVVEGLALLRALSADHDFKVLVAIWPSFHDDRVVDVHEMPGGHGGELVIERLASAYGIPTVRLSRFYEQEAKSANEPVNPRLRYTIGDKLHPSVEGCRIAAAALHETLEQGAAKRAVSDGSSTPEAQAHRAALEAAESLGEVEPDYSVVHTNTADHLMAAGEVDQAIAYYELALEQDPEMVEAHNNLGMALFAQGKVDEAVEHYRRAIASNPDFAQAHNNLANALRAMGKGEEAIAQYRLALKIQPDMADAHFNLGNILATGKQFDEAIIHFRRALELRPEYAAAHANLGNALQSQGQLEEAVEHYREALRIGPATAKAHFGLGFALRTRGEVDEAVHHLRKALELEPDHVAARRTLEATLSNGTDTP